MINSLKLVFLYYLFLSFFSDPITAAELSEILKRGQLIVAVKDNLPSLSSYNNQGQLEGLEIDIAKRLAQEILGSSDYLILQPTKNQDRLRVVIEGKVDIAIARVSFTASRNRVVDFSPYYYLDSTGLITRHLNLKTLEDLRTEKIAVLQESSTIAVIREALPQAQLIGVNSYQEALELLESDKVKVFAADNSLLTGWVKAYPQYIQLPIKLSGEALVIVMPKGLQYREIRAKINQMIVQWQRSGWLRERATYWGLP